MTRKSIEPTRIMVVDDVPANLKMLSLMLEHEGYVPQVFPGGRLALEAAIKTPPDLVLLDINMPEMDGYEVCERLKSFDKLADIPVIFLSANLNTIDKVKAFQVGGIDYVTKPFEFEEVQARINTHLELRRVRMELERHNANLQSLVEEKIQDILTAKEEISQAQLATILAMSKIAEARDNDTGKHIERTQYYCMVLSTAMSEWEEYREMIPQQFIENITHASPLHDIGKVAIPDNVLLKEGKLTNVEFETMKTHASLGAATLQSVLERYPGNDFIRMGMEIARGHHEKWDGTGYPEGLKGGEIPLAARIMAVADVYDALRSKRCYKPPFSHEKACEIIVTSSGAHFDPDVVKAFQSVAGEFSDVNERHQD